MVASAEEEVNGKPSQALCLVTGCMGKIIGAADVYLIIAWCPISSSKMLMSILLLIWNT